MVDLPDLSTKRLRLRQVRLSDAGLLNLLVNDWDVVKWLTSAPWPNPLSETQAWLAKGPAAYLLERDDGPVGVVGLEGELGYWIGKRYWGRGYVSEAVEAIVPCAFDRLGMADLDSGYLDGNAKSAAVLRNNGFVDAGDSSVFSRSRKEYVLNHRMRLTAADWRASRDWRVETERLIIAPHREQDLPDYAAMAGDPEVARMLATVPSPLSEDEARRRHRRRRFRNRPGFSAAIRLKGGPMVGEVGLSPDAPPSLGYWIGRPHWRNGYAQEALSAFTKDMFARFDIDQIAADAFIDNPASSHVMEKTGFEAVGKGEGTSVARDGPYPVTRFRLTRARAGVMRRA